MAASDRLSPGFWVICPEDYRRPVVVDLPGLGRAVALFSSEDEALLYRDLRGTGGPDGRRVSGAGLLTLLSGRWAGYRSVALDPIPELAAGTLLPLTTTSRERFVRFLRSAERGGRGRVARDAVGARSGDPDRYHPGMFERQGL
jgi:hypothetical protein